nr:hypothetical protein [Tanacetum cinerariifolium]
MEHKYVTTKQFWKTHKKFNQVLHLGVLQLAEKAIEELIENNLKPCIIATLQQQLYFKMKRSLQNRANDLALWKILKHKFEKSTTSKTFCRDDEIHSHHDDHQDDDAPLKGEKRVKRHKALKISKSAREEIIIDEDEVIPEDETPELITELQDVDKRVPTIFYYERMKATLNDMLSNHFKNVEEYAYRLEQTTNFMKNKIVWESR